ncbi:MAG: hypothetical protein NUW21_01035, partial [Elusimicrobia bacterium]|nr:hypothetical protein [Elusimicrobiota bacterium]
MARTSVSSARVFLVESRLKRPFITALGRRESTVNAAILLRLKGGAEGYGEASTSIAQKHLTPAALRRALQSMALRARGRDVRGWRALVDEAWARHGKLSPAVAAFEAALLSALAQEADTSLAGWLGGATRRLETDVTSSASNDAAINTAAAREAAAAGFRVLKVKIG